MSQIWTDTVLFHVTLLLSAFELEKRASRKDQLRSKRLTRECISLLQDRVNSSGPDCTSNETLSAIAGLAAVEVCERSYFVALGGADRLIARERQFPTRADAHEWSQTDPGCSWGLPCNSEVKCYCRKCSLVVCHSVHS